MSSFDKLIQKIFEGSHISYKDAERLLLKLGYVLRIHGSHHVFKKEGFENIILTNKSQLLHYQIHDLREALDEHDYKKK